MDTFDQIPPRLKEYLIGSNSLSLLAEEAADHFGVLWDETEDDPRIFDSIPAISTVERRRTEALIREAVAECEQFVKKGASAAMPETDARAFVERLKEKGRGIPFLDNLYIDTVLADNFIASTREYVQEHEKFDPRATIDEAYQALRNVWIMNSLQLEFGLPVRMTKPIFGYSMLYPATDNIFDAKFLPLETKLTFLGELKKMVNGDIQGNGPLTPLFKAIHDEFPPASLPEVHDSIKLIYDAQVASLMQQSAGIGVNAKRDAQSFRRNIHRITFFKGGTSVLADGYLVKGELSDREFMFCMGFGAALQLLDDVQDVATDEKNGHTTLVSRTLNGKPADSFARRLMIFLRRIVTLYLDTDSALGSLIEKNCSFLLTNAVMMNPGHFSRTFRAKCEEHFPASEKLLRQVKKRLAIKERGISLAGRILASL